MSTNPVYVFEHAATNTLARAHHASRDVQILRDGKEIARYPAHSNYAVSFAEGRLAWFDASAKLRWVDLDSVVFPAEGARGPVGAKILRSRATVLAFYDPRYLPKDLQVAPGLAVVDLDGKVIEVGGCPPRMRAWEWRRAPETSPRPSRSGRSFRAGSWRRMGRPGRRSTRRGWCLDARE